MVAQKGSTTNKKGGKKEIPDSLIYEIMDGKPIYYKGYREVLNKTKTLEEIMACSGLQGIIISYILRTLFTKLDPKKYHILTNEIGVHIEHKNNLASDIGIYDKKILTPEKITTHYPDVPAKIFIEIDIKAELEDITETGYIKKKTQKLLDFGVEKVIWILSNPQQVIVATPGSTWEMHDWNMDIALLDGELFNVGDYLKEEGIQLQ